MRETTSSAVLGSLDTKPLPTSSERARKRKWPKIHQECGIEFRRMMDATWDDRVMSLNDRLFVDVAGQQWAGLVDENDRRPKLEMNKTNNAVIRLEGEYRNNRCSVSFLPKDGSPKSDLADACDGLYRADEQDSFGHEAYDNAAGDQIKGGYGAWRLRAVPANPDDPEDETQRIALEPIVDPETSVFYDLDCKFQNKSDARHCAVLHTITRERYMHEYGDDPTSWQDSAKQTFLYSADWFTPDVVTLCEWYVVRREPEKWLVFVDLQGEEFERRASDFEPEDEDEPDAGDGPAELAELQAMGNRLIGEKTKKPHKVTKYTMSGSRVLREEEIPGGYIPIVVVYGKRSYIRNKERWSGIVRLAKDAQRVLNALMSWLLEIAAQTVIPKPIFDPSQIIGHKNEWAEHANGVNKAYLTANALRNDDNTIAAAPGPIGYTPMAELPQALAAALQFVGVDLKELLGSQEQGEKMVSNISGKAVEMIQRHLDAHTKIFSDNFVCAMQFCGTVWGDMARELYVEDGRKMKTIGADRKGRGTVTLGEPGVTDDGHIMLDGLIDLSKAAFDVVVDVGPSSETRRAAIAKENAALLAICPPELAEARSAIMWNLLANVEGEGMGPTNEWAQMKLVEMGIGKPTPDQEEKMKAKAEASKQTPDPQAQALQAQGLALMADAKRNDALATKAQADTALSVAKTKQAEADVALKRAETLRTISEVDRDTSAPRDGGNDGQGGNGRQPVEFNARR